jgi:Response regulator containing a CheY-like receiver domain and an HTH DNA-binding domain
MSEKIQRLLEKFPDVGSTEELGDVIELVRDLYDLENVIYFALSLGHKFIASRRRTGGALNGTSGVWMKESATLAALTYPDAWVNHYTESGYARIDPTIEASSNSFMPVDWKTIRWDTRQKRDFLKEATEAGVGNQGYSVPVRGPDGQFAVFTLNKSCSDEEWCRLTAEFATDFMLIGNYFHQKVLEISGEIEEREQAKLSTRERDALTLISTGKSRAQAAHDLGISDNTLRVYLDLHEQERGLGVVAAAAGGRRYRSGWGSTCTETSTNRASR